MIKIFDIKLKSELIFCNSLVETKRDRVQLITLLNSIFAIQFCNATNIKQFLYHRIELNKVYEITIDRKGNEFKIKIENLYD